jgi:membrane-associated phospholipid phosphatase
MQIALNNSPQDDSKESSFFLMTVWIRVTRCQIWDDLLSAGLIPVFVVVLILTIIVNVYVGDLALNFFNRARWLGMGFVVGLFLIVTVLIDIAASLSKLKSFTDRESGNVNISALWKTIFTNPVGGGILILVMTFGITSAQSLSEYYRINLTVWYDADLWALEASLFYFLKGSIIDFPGLWDRIYFTYWTYLILVYCVLYRLRRFYDLSIITIATVFCYFMTRWIAIQFPTAGPAFFRPELFDLSGTISQSAQEMLVQYMQGNVPQNGFIPGTMGMPSLHIGITVMGAWYLARYAKWTLWLSVLWTCLIWLSTIMLGWHYALDGVGGIVVALASLLVAHVILWLMNFRSNHMKPKKDEHCH